MAENLGGRGPQAERVTNNVETTDAQQRKVLRDALFSAHRLGVDVLRDAISDSEEDIVIRELEHCLRNEIDGFDRTLGAGRGIVLGSLAERLEMLSEASIAMNADEWKEVQWFANEVQKRIRNETLHNEYFRKTWDRARQSFIDGEARFADEKGEGGKDEENSAEWKAKLLLLLNEVPMRADRVSDAIMHVTSEDLDDMVKRLVERRAYEAERSEGAQRGLRALEDLWLLGGELPAHTWNRVAVLRTAIKGSMPMKWVTPEMRERFSAIENKFASYPRGHVLQNGSFEDEREIKSKPIVEDEPPEYRQRREYRELLETYPLPVEKLRAELAKMEPVEISAGILSWYSNRIEKVDRMSAYDQRLTLFVVNDMLRFKEYLPKLAWEVLEQMLKKLESVAVGIDEEHRRDLDFVRNRFASMLSEQRKEFKQADEKTRELRAKLKTLLERYYVSAEEFKEAIAELPAEDVIDECADLAQRVVGGELRRELFSVTRLLQSVAHACADPALQVQITEVQERMVDAVRKEKDMPPMAEVRAAQQKAAEKREKEQREKLERQEALGKFFVQQLTGERIDSEASYVRRMIAALDEQVIRNELSAFADAAVEKGVDEIAKVLPRLVALRPYMPNEDLAKFISSLQARLSKTWEEHDARSRKESAEVETPESKKMQFFLHNLHEGWFATALPVLIKEHGKKWYEDATLREAAKKGIAKLLEERFMKVETIEMFAKQSGFVGKELEAVMRVPKRRTLKGE